MKTKKRLVVANWKMNPAGAEEAKRIAQSIKRSGSKLKNTEVVIAPSFIHLSLGSKILDRSRKVFLGAQNVNEKEVGAYTGEVGTAQIKDLKVKFVLVGHSERRAKGETNELVNTKMRALLAQGFTPILCFGEKERDIEGGYFQFVRKQLLESLRDIQKKDLLGVVLAYEPVWAIGKSFRESMTATDMHEMSLFIRKVLIDSFGEDYSNLPLLYGGSVEVENVEDLMKKGRINGLLVGHESLIPEDFRKILKIVDASK